MKNYLSVADLAIWLTLIVGKVVLCLCIVRKDLVRRLRWFSLYVFLSTANSILLLSATFLASYSTYYYIFYISGHMESVLAFATLLECGRRVLPGLDLPQKGKAISLLLAALAAVLIFASLWPMRYLEKRIDLGAGLAIAVTFIFIAVYSRYLGLYWSRLVAGIASGLGLLYLVDSVTKAMTGHYPSAFVLQVRQLSQISYALAILAWIVVVLSPWGTRELSEQDLKKIEAAFARIEASLGTGETKTA